MDEGLSTCLPPCPLSAFTLTWLLSRGGGLGGPHHVEGEGVPCQVASVLSNSLQPHRLQPARCLCPQDSPGKNTGVGCHSLLWGTFPTQGSNPDLLCLLHCRQILYPLSHLGSPKQIANIIFVLFNLDGNTSSKNNQNIL